MTGWEKEFSDFKHVYFNLIEETMQKKQETDISFLEESLCELTGRKYAVACASGTDALEASLRATGIGRVLVSSFSWLSSATAASLTGSTPAFCDIEYGSYHMNMETIKWMMTPGIQAIIFPQLFGNVTDLSELEEYCDDHGIVLIEDACQAIGASVNGKMAGSQGDVSTLSFNANKNIAGFSGGGAILTDDGRIAEYCRLWRQHGGGEFLGRNSKMLLLDATVIDHRLKSIWEWHLWRQSIADIYNEKLNGYPVELQCDLNPDVDHSYHKYVVRFENQEVRDKVREKVGGVVHYPMPIHQESMFASRNNFMQSSIKDNTPVANEVCKTILTLPLHHTMNVNDVIKNAEIVCRVLD